MIRAYDSRIGSVSIDASALVSHLNGDTWVRALRIERGLHDRGVGDTDGAGHSPARVLRAPARSDSHQLAAPLRRRRSNVHRFQFDSIHPARITVASSGPPPIRHTPAAVEGVGPIPQIFGKGHSPSDYVTPSRDRVETASTPRGN